MIFDSEAHIGELMPYGSYQEPPAVLPRYTIEDFRAWRPGHHLDDDLAALLQSMDRHGIDRSVVMRGRCFQDNTHILEAVKRHPSKLVGFASFGLYPPAGANPRQTQVALDTLEDGLAKGCLGVGELCFSDFSEDAGAVPREIAPILEMCASRQAPVFFHTGADSATHVATWVFPSREREEANLPEPEGRLMPVRLALRNPSVIEELAYQFPTVPLLAGHMGMRDGSFFEAALMLARRFPNVYLTTSFTRQEFIERAVAEAGAHKVIFGSDFKRTTPPTPVDDAWNLHRMHVDAVTTARIADAAKELILGGNLNGLLCEVRSPRQPSDPPEHTTSLH